MKNMFNKRTLTKIRMWFGKKLNPYRFQQITGTERDVIMIFNALVHHPDSDLLIRPGNDKYYIKSVNSGIFITLSTYLSEISIINHVYGYNVKLGSRAMKNMESTFINEVEKRRTLLEIEYNNNIKHSLKHIAKTIKNRL